MRPTEQRGLMAWLGDGGGGNVQLVKEIPVCHPWGLEKESRKEVLEAERKRGKLNKKGKKRGNGKQEGERHERE